MLYMYICYIYMERERAGEGNWERDREEKGEKEF